MEKIIATFPCRDASALIAFYQHLGFELAGQYTRGYLVFRYNELELHFYGSKMFVPQDNSSMCIIQTDNLEQLYDVFTTGLKANMGKIPRSGFPKISKIRDLSEDQRFTLADPSGNTIYVIQRKEARCGTFFRDIENEQYAEKFSVLYDLIYSKEDLKIANNLLPQLLAVKDSLGDMDKAKLLLLAIEIFNGLGMSYDDSELGLLIQEHKKSDEWKRIEKKLKKMRVKENGAHVCDKKKSNADMDTAKMKRLVYDIPDFVAAALDESGLWERYRVRPPYQRNDYIGWITRAKREGTRQKRLHQMLDELQNGDSYMGMAYNAK